MPEETTYRCKASGRTGIRAFYVPKGSEPVGVMPTWIVGIGARWLGQDRLTIEIVMPEYGRIVVCPGNWIVEHPGAAHGVISVGPATFDALYEIDDFETAIAKVNHDIREAFARIDFSAIDAAIDAAAESGVGPFIAIAGRIVPCSDLPLHFAEVIAHETSRPIPKNPLIRDVEQHVGQHIKAAVSSVASYDQAIARHSGGRNKFAASAREGDIIITHNAERAREVMRSLGLTGTAQDTIKVRTAASVGRASACIKATSASRIIIDPYAAVVWLEDWIRSFPRAVANELAGHIVQTRQNDPVTPEATVTSAQVNQ